MRSMRMDSASRARARSSARPTILEYLMPASGLNSQVVALGRARLDLADAREAVAARGLPLLLGVLLDDLPPHLLLPPRLEELPPRGAQGLPAAAHAGAEGGEERGERELGGEDEGDEDGGSEDDVGAGAVEAAGQGRPEQRAHRAARAHRLALDGERDEGEGEEGAERQQEERDAAGLGVGGLDGLA